MRNEKRRALNRLGDTDRLMYEMGLVALGIFIAAVLLYLLTGFSVLSIKYPCLFNVWTGLPCPGCGGTRAFRALLSGDFIKSLYCYFPLMPAVIVFIIFMIRCTLYIFFGVRKSPNGAIIKYLYIFVALIFVQWFVKLASQLIWNYNWLYQCPF